MVFSLLCLYLSFQALVDCIGILISIAGFFGFTEVPESDIKKIVWRITENLLVVPGTSASSAEVLS